MATINLVFTVSDGTVAAIKNDFAAQQGWTATIPDPQNPGQTIANPESQNAFIKRNIGEYIKNTVRTKRMRDVEMAELANVEANVVLT